MEENVKFKPFLDRILVEQDPVEEKQIGRIFIPVASEDRPVKGTVVAVGNGRNGVPMTVKQGDRIYFSKNTGVPVEIEWKKYLMMREVDVWGIL